MKSIWILAAGLCVTGCAMGEGSKWISADSRTVQIEGIPYQVQFVRDASGFDMRGVRTEFIVVMPDPLSERRRNTQAALMVAQAMCPTAKVTNEMKIGDMYTTRVNCGAT